MNGLSLSSHRNSKTRRVMDNTNATLNELKKSMKQFEAVKLDNPIDVKVRVFNFRTGCADTIVNMKVKFVGKVPYSSLKAEDDFASHVMMVYGEETFSSGNTYLGSEKLTYTDDEELRKVIDAIKDKPVKKFEEYDEELRKY